MQRMRFMGLMVMLDGKESEGFNLATPMVKLPQKLQTANCGGDPFNK